MKCNIAESGSSNPIREIELWFPVKNKETTHERVRGAACKYCGGLLYDKLLGVFPQRCAAIEKEKSELKHVCHGYRV
jgi:hypothetical protein